MAIKIAPIRMYGKDNDALRGAISRLNDEVRLCRTTEPDYFRVEGHIDAPSVGKKGGSLWADSSANVYSYSTRVGKPVFFSDTQAVMVYTDRSFSRTTAAHLDHISQNLIRSEAVFNFESINPKANRDVYVTELMTAIKYAAGYDYVTAKKADLVNKVDCLCVGLYELTTFTTAYNHGDAWVLEAREAVLEMYRKVLAMPTKTKTAKDRAALVIAGIQKATRYVGLDLTDVLDVA